MKQFTFKWLKRLWALIAVKLLIIAILVTAIRVVTIRANDFKAQLIEWIATEHNINVSIDKISAGIDFSGVVLTLKGVNFIDEEEVLPFDLTFEHLFLHFDFVNSLSKQTIIFNDISLKGADLVVKSYSQFEDMEGEQSELTLDSLKRIFLSRLNSFSIKDSSVNFTDHLYHKKTIYIQDLSWLNDGLRHQGVGKASLPDTLGDNTLEFLVDITGDAKGDNEQLIANIYANAENLNATEYLKPQVNPLAELTKAIVSFELWTEFDFNGPKSVQFKWGDSDIVWSMLGQSHDVKVNKGELQFTYQDKHWLFDSYDLNFLQDHLPTTDIHISGSGVDGEFADFDLDGVSLNSVTPFAFLFSSLSESELTEIATLELGGELEKVGMSVEKPGEFSLRLGLDGFNNQPLDFIPGISDANISISANINSGYASIKLAPQNIYFDDGQFSRAMPIKNGEFELSWTNDENGVELKSEHSLLKTDDIDSITQFSLLFPSQNAKNRSPFLSLYSYASLNDASKVRYYLPIKAIGDDVFNYLQPTLKKGVVNGAQVLWYGNLLDYPYQQKNGIFQAWIPLRDAEYDFYGDWEGLRDLDLDLLFENDSLLMKGENAKLGEIEVKTLIGEVDHLTPNGVLTINANVNDDGEVVADYFIDSPLKESVGHALTIINVEDELEANLTLSIPFYDQYPDIEGKVELLGNDIDIELTDNMILPLKQVSGTFNFKNGDLLSEELSATLFDQPIDFSFSSEELKEEYKVKANLSGNWDVGQISEQHSVLLPFELSGRVDWQGDLTFTQIFDGGCLFNVDFTSPLQGLNTQFPVPYNKDESTSWPTKVNINGDLISTKWDARIDNKIKFLGEVNYQTEQLNIPFLYLRLGKEDKSPIDYAKKVVSINEETVNLTEWLKVSQGLLLTEKSNPVESRMSPIQLDDFYLNIKQAELFKQPITSLHSHLDLNKKGWDLNLKGNNLLADLEYRQGLPDRYNIDIEQFNFELFDLDEAKLFFASENENVFAPHSDNLREDYPEIFLECKQCRYKKMQLSPLSAHVFPSKLHYTIDYLRLGGKKEFTSLSGVWNQLHTNVIIDSRENDKNSIVKRLGFTRPMVSEQAELSAAVNWVGAPWEFNLTSLNGDFSIEAKNGLITEINDKGARLLSFLSLDGIRRSLNLEFDNVFSKGLGFDSMSMSGKISNGVIKSNDYYLNGSAGKVTGDGLIDLPNLNVNYQFSYSPAVTSSLPVLAAFAINPLTGAAVLMLTKILEPVVNAIIRVDFSVKGSLNDPKVKIESREKGKIKLQNSEVLEEMEENQLVETGTETEVGIHANENEEGSGYVAPQVDIDVDSSEEADEESDGYTDSQVDPDDDDRDVDIGFETDFETRVGDEVSSSTSDATEDGAQ